jgi:hypothetical protein
VHAETCLKNYTRYQVNFITNKNKQKSQLINQKCNSRREALVECMLRFVQVNTRYQANFITNKNKQKSLLMNILIRSAIAGRRL